MCGIAGILTLTEGGRPPEVDDLIAMMARIGHRGPDSAGYLRDGRAALGSVRLSILDVAGGDQPIQTEDGRFVIVFNGEIYNYIELRDVLAEQGDRFVTTTDTEVVLRAWAKWGADCLAKLNGAFAFAIYDRKTRSLALARDRYGKRPLYYTQARGQLYFASEVKGFLDLEHVVFETDPTHLASVLGTWTPMPHQSCWAGIDILPPGHWVKVDADGPGTPQPFAPLRFASPDLVQSPEGAAALTRDAITEATRLRLRSDVPVGLYLSGGLDSSIIAALLSKMLPHGFRSYSVSFEEAHLDEAPYQKIVADRFGASHTSLPVTAGDICAAFPDAVYHAEIPVFRTAFVPMFLLSRHVRDDGTKTVFSGEGADEAFLGYDLFRETYLRRAWAKLDLTERKARVERLNTYLGHFSDATHGALLGLYENYQTEAMPGLFSHEIRYQNGKFAQRLLADGALVAQAFDGLSGYAAADPVFTGSDAVQRAQWLEYKTLLCGYLLSTQGDRMGMAHGVENRCPFLDPNVVAMSGAVNRQFDGIWNEKAVLKQAFPELPAEIRARHKHPYRAPDSASFVAERPDYLELVLSADALGRSGLIDLRFAQRLVQKIITAAPERISVSENQAFVYLLTFQMLQEQFVSRRATPKADRAGLEARLTTQITEQEAAA
jgi:asparagine synthase (glutamine-hydrolysing)